MERETDRWELADPLGDMEKLIEASSPQKVDFSAGLCYNASPAARPAGAATWWKKDLQRNAEQAEIEIEVWKERFGNDN